MATLTLDTNSKRIIAVLAGGDAQPAATQWTVSPPGYLGLRPSDAAPFARDIVLYQPGVVTITATFFDAAGNEIAANPAPVSQVVAVAGDIEGSRTIAESTAAVTVPYSAQNHQDAFGPTPTVAPGADNGTTPPTPDADANGSDISGFVAFGSGTGPAAGAQVVVTFNAPWPAPPPVEVVAGNPATAALEITATAISTTEFTITSAVAPAADQPAGTYVVNYQVGN